jgi:sugar lactone lactonase YvrE
MKKLLLLILVQISLLNENLLEAQVITTCAGTGTAGFSGDGGPATNAQFVYPQALAFDAAGNMYIADNSNSRIRKINTSGIISTVAGSSINGYSGDGGPATSAKLNMPYGVAVDAAGNLYIADYFNHRVRKVNTSGVISTFAGNGTFGYSGDGAAATSAQLYYPSGVAADAAGNVYIADNYNNCIRKVNTSGIISTIAGTGLQGSTGDGGPATSATLYRPSSICVDAAGNIFIADYDNRRVRKVSNTGTITAFAGTGAGGFSGDGGQAALATFYNPSGVAVDPSGNVYIVDQNNSRVRKVNTSGIISTIAGSTYGYGGDGGDPVLAKIANPYGIALDATGKIYIADTYNQRIRKIDLTLSAAINEINMTSETKVFPNPNNGEFSIMINSEKNFTMELVDILGQIIATEEVGPYKNKIRFNGPKGIYTYQIKTENKLISTGKIVIN